MKLQVLKEFDLGVEPRYMYSANVKLGDRDGMLFFYTEGNGVDPGEELLRFNGIKPMHIALFEMDGTRLWDKELPDGVLPGIWFCPVVPFDMDKDGVDEIYYINNTGAPFSFMHRKIERIDALTGEVTGSWPWMWNTFEERLSLCYRFYIVAGYAHGEPVLVTCQGTYGNMYLQGWNNNMEKRWEIVIKDSDPGPRASHVTPVMDFNDDGVDELFWGERLISMDDGHEVIDYAPDYKGHSDLICPYMDYKTGDWYIFTCREGDDQEGVKRVFSFKKEGGIAWEQVDYGHMHTAWSANVLDGYGKIFMAMRQKFQPDDSGFVHVLDGIFYFDAYTGEPVDFKLPCLGTEVLPIDLDGDGYHEFLVTRGDLAGSVLDRHGEVMTTMPEGFGGKIRMGKILDAPGEHLMIKKPNSSIVQIVGDVEAVDGEIMQKRYALPYLRFMQKLMATGYNAVDCHISCGV